MEFIAVIVVCFVLVLGFFLPKSNWLKWQSPKSTQADMIALRAYEARQSLFVNQPELALFTALNANRPNGFHVMAKVRLEDILCVGNGVKDGRLRWQYRGRIKSRHVDFVLCDGLGRILCAIELDGSSHSNTEAKMVDAFKDAVFNNVGLPLLRIKTGTDFDGFAQKSWQRLQLN